MWNAASCLWRFVMSWCFYEHVCRGIVTNRWSRRTSPSGCWSRKAPWLLSSSPSLFLCLLLFRTTCKLHEISITFITKRVVAMVILFSRCMWMCRLVVSFRCLLVVEMGKMSFCVGVSSAPNFHIYRQFLSILGRHFFNFTIFICRCSPRQLGLTGRCVVCLEEKKGGATCVSSETGAPGSSNESPPGAAERVVHFLCQECIPMSLG